MQEADPHSSYIPQPGYTPEPGATGTGPTSNTGYTGYAADPTMPPPPVQAASGLSDSAAGAIAYITIIPAIIFLVLEPYNRRPFVRFHAFQSLALGVIWFATSLLTVIPVLGWIVEMVLFVVLFVAWIMCIIKASQGIRYKLPIIGDMVENMAR